MFEDSAVESMWLKAHRKHLTPQPRPAINVGVFERAFRHWFKVPGFKAELLESAPQKTAYRLSWP